MATKGRIRSVEQKCVLGKWVSERSLRGQFGLSPRHAEESAECLLQLQTHSPADVTGEGSRKHDEKANVSDDLVTPGGRFITLISANRVSSHSSNVGGRTDHKPVIN
ncbi:unnamed protein product [Leuciscus chuanchicus]